MVSEGSLNNEGVPEATASKSAAQAIGPAASNQLHVDFSCETGEIQPLHGINFGPLSMSGIFDFSEEHKALKIPSTRLHDCPFAIPGTVDIHCLFPLFHADPTDEKNYVFPITDDYIQSIVDVGSDIVFRLGESIEHHKRGKYFIHPPANFEKWAEICVNVIRHYNEGWANGFHHGITYWEIWNEAWSLCWTGTPEAFYRLYEVTAKRIKAHNPNLKVGSGGSGTWDSFLEGLVSHCRKTGAPLDYLVWHSYQHHPKENATLARQIREKLDQAGFPDAELHLNEWAHNPNNDWSYVGNGGPAKAENAERLIARIQGAPGAAFNATMFAWMQDLPVDVSNYYWGREGIWGIFDNYGGQTRLYNAFEAFVKVLDLKTRVHTEGNDEAAGLAVLASIDTTKNEAAVLVSHFESTTRDFTLNLNSLPWEGATEIRTLVVDNEHALEEVSRHSTTTASTTLTDSIPAPSIRLYLLKRQPCDRVPRND